ncbi:MAG: DNA-3-methyladenine glycosylase family protein [Thermoleophilaceae bacterium]
MGAVAVGPRAGRRAVVEVDACPPGPYRLPPGGRDGILRRRGAVRVRVLHSGDEQVLAAAWVAGNAVRVRAEAPTRDAAAWGVDRMRFALGVDHDVRPFQRAFRRDRLIGPVIRRKPWLRPIRRPEPFEALAWAITEQLIDSDRAVRIQRALTRRWGRRSACGTMRDAPAAAELARRCQPELQSCDLSAGRALALIRASREVAAGRVDLEQHEPAWRRLIQIREIGPWTLEKLAFHGQGRDDQLPAGDLAYVKLVGRLAGLGRRAEVHEVREFFAPYEPYAALAGMYLLHAPHAYGPVREPLRVRGPAPVAARW